MKLVVLNLTLNFLYEKFLVNCVIQVASTPGYEYTGYSTDFLKKMIELHFTVRYKLLHLTQRLLMSKDSDSNTRADFKNSENQKSLFYVIKSDYKQMIKLLLK